ncbi:MAG: cytochrome c [Alphaproteobacteria bacterium]|nr:cytochrome c [Alphaproteobacteria bacterium]MBM3642159.1 cytochrome c [Alphaproteobacteria bacterium]
MLRFAPLAVAPLLLFAAGVAYAKAPADAQLLKRGRAIAQQNCGRCHAVSASGESANPKSPPFRYLARKYPLNNLEEALAEGIVVGHEGVEMPQFRLSAAQIEALLAYLNSIQR